MTAIRKHLRDFIAVLALMVIALVTTWVIVQEQRLRVPILEERPFELKAEFETAQAVVPGQGQDLRVAGVKVGDVQEVELVDGRGIVTFAVQRDFLPIYRNATLLLRPQTGLKDMFFQMDPGTKEAGEMPDAAETGDEEDEVIPLANTAPDVNLDQILDALDTDTQAYLRLLLTGAGEGLENRGEDLGEVLGSLGPLNRNLARLNREVAKRKEALARLVTNFNRLTGTVGRAERDLTRLVSSSNAAVGAIAERDPELQRAIALLPGTLDEAERTLNRVSEFASVLGPAFDDLRPFARNLPEMNASVRRLAASATPVLRTEIRPFVRQARKRVPDLRIAAKRFSEATPKLTVVGKKINKLGNMAAFNPGGAEPPGTAGRDEGYLFWAGWLGHHGSSVFENQDANGLYRRIYLTVGCEEAADIANAELGIGGLLTGLTELFDPVNGVFPPGALVDPALCPEP